MNAYELADKLTALEMADELEKGPLIPRDSAAKMIRQQADRIAELEKQLKIKESIYAAEPYLSDWAKRVKEQYLPQIKELSDRELVVFLMDEIDRASEWLVDGETHMAIGVLGQCHAKIRKHLSNTKES